MSPTKTQAARAGNVPLALETASVAVLSGGPSNERDVSLASGSAVAAALGSGGMPARVIEVEIDVDGQWVVGGESLAAHRALEALGPIDVFFLALHGAYGEDGTVQGLLEATGQRYTGSGVRSSALCMDKQALRLLAVDAGLRVAPGVTVSGYDWKHDRQRQLAGVHGVVGETAVVKPRNGGSSVGTTIVKAETVALCGAIEGALAEDRDCLVEALVEGVEVSCGVLGNHNEELRALPPVEIRPAAGRFFDYQQKYDPAGAQELCPTQSLSEAAQQAVMEASKRVHRLAGCDGYSRVDFIVTHVDGSQAPVLLEINTLPGLTPRSLLPQEAKVTGLDYRNLCLEIVARALALA